MNDSLSNMAAGRLVTKVVDSSGKQGFDYEVGISAETAGASGIHMQLLTIPPGARAKAHRHRSHETAIFGLKGTSAVWHGPNLQQHSVVPEGAFFYIPADVPHLPYNPSRIHPATAVISRTDPNEQESVELLPDLEALASPVRRADPYVFFGTATDILIGGEATGGEWALLRVEKPPGASTPPHLHTREDETVAMIEGVLHVEVGGQTIDLTAGDVATLPRNVAHRLSNRSGAPCRYHLFCTPAGFDTFVREAGQQRGSTAQPLSDPSQAAIRAGIAFLDESALAESRIASARAVMRSFDAPRSVLGAWLEMQDARSGPGAPCLLRQTIPPGVTIPLHSEPAPLAFTLLDGSIDLYAAGLGHWETITAPGIVNVPGGDPLALRNSSGQSATLLRVVTEREAAALREIAHPLGDNGAQGLATHGSSQAQEAARTLGYCFAAADEAAAI